MKVKVEGVSGAALHLQREARAGVLPEGRLAPLAVVQALPREQADLAGEKERVDRDALEKATEKANKIMETYSTELRFSIHEASGELMVKVVNVEDNSVIREIPPERILDFVAHVKKMLGIIIDKFI